MRRILYYAPVRETIKNRFKNLVDEEFQKDWCDQNYKHAFSDSLDHYVFDYLFNTPWASLWDEAYKCIDVTLYNEEEAEMISNYLDFWYRTFKWDMPDSYYLEHSKWSELIEGAKKIVQTMEENNKKYNLKKDLESWFHDQDNNTPPGEEEYRIMEARTNARQRRYDEMKQNP